MSKVLFESKVKLEGAFFKRYLVLDEKKFEIKKKKSLFSSEMEVIDSYLIKDIKMTNSRILVRVKDVKYVEIIMNDKTLLMKFSNEELANEFSNKLIELKEKDSMFSRSLDLVKGLDVGNAIKIGLAVVALASKFVKNEKVKKGLKVAGEVGSSIINAIDLK